MKWDGNFKTSKYKETGNMVLDVIENDGRIFHEATTDGYTHEIVDRGRYISDDYYFPNKKCKGKAHIHYEFRSNGEVLIDGKNIFDEGTGGMAMRLVRVRSLDGKADSRYQNSSIDNNLECQDKLQRLGEAFVSEKKELEEKMEKVQDSDIDVLAKKRALDVLEEKLARIKERYERDVVEEEKRCQEQTEQNIEELHEMAEDIQEQADGIKDWKSEVTDEDGRDVAEELEERKKELERMKEEYLREQSLRIEQANLQYRTMRAQGFKRKR